MKTTRIGSHLLLALCVFVVSSTSAMGQDADGCAHFTWDVTHEVAVMKQPAVSVAASSSADSPTPVIEVDKPYDLELFSQAVIRFAVKPAKPTLNDSAQGGIVRFHTSKSGLYRVSITSGHWIDIVDTGQLIRSRDFQGSRGCARPRKIVAYQLPANRDLLLQLSGGTESIVTLAVTFANPDSSPPSTPN
jgi:hypothetical protein